MMTMISPPRRITAAGLPAGRRSSNSPAPVARYNLDFQAHPQINAGAPLKVRVMLLTSDAEFMSADFYSLQNQPPPRWAARCSTISSSS